MANPEHAPLSPERSAEQQRDLERAPEVLDHKAERAGEESREDKEKQVETARAEAEQEAISGREVSKGEHKPHNDESRHIPHRSRKESFEHTMKDVRAELSAPERVFSNIIHNPVIEKVSDVAGKTIARPDAILSGSFFACVFVLGLYLLARYYGFALQGSETIVAFAVGWLFGIIFDLLRGMITGKRS